MNATTATTCKIRNAHTPHGECPGTAPEFPSEIMHCGDCGQPVRYSTAYDEPHYVHVNIADTVACPMYASAR